MRVIQRCDMIHMILMIPRAALSGEAGLLAYFVFVLVIFAVLVWSR